MLFNSITEILASHAHQLQLQASQKLTIVALYSGAMPGNALMANHSLNRTLCGGPILGSKS